MIDRETLREMKNDPRYWHPTHMNKNYRDMMDLAAHELSNQNMIDRHQETEAKEMQTKAEGTSANAHKRKVLQEMVEIRSNQATASPAKSQLDVLIQKGYAEYTNGDFQAKHLIEELTRLMPES